MKKLVRKIADTRFAVVLYVLNQAAVFFVHSFLKISWFFRGKKKPNKKEIQTMRENVTFIFKTFERQKLAKKLYKNIQNYYPGVKVIIADDSKNPLNIQDNYLDIIRLPFNSGLSYGLNGALEKVETPFIIRMDDDELLTPYTRFHEHLEFLMEHLEVDLVGVLPYNLPWPNLLKKMVAEYYTKSMNNAPKKLRIPHLTQMAEGYKVFGKVPNIFIARTDKMREVGYDDNIRMLDHHEFFYRAAGNLVSVLDETAYVLHCHNQFDHNYQKYRSDIGEDIQYINNKMKSIDIKSRFLEALGVALKKESVSWTNVTDTEWTDLFELAGQQQVLPLVFEAVYNCPAAKDSKEVLEPYRKTVFQQTARQVVKTDEFLKLYSKLCDAGVKPLVVKGLVCRSHYRLPNHRPSSDEDIFILEEGLKLAHQVMEQEGMHLLEPEMDIYKAHEVPYKKKGGMLCVEMHKQLFPNDAEAYNDYNHFFEQAHANAITEMINGVGIHTMCYTDHLLYLICHAFKHFLHSGVGVRQVCDIVLFANAHGNEINWEWILTCCKEMRAEKIVSAMFRIGKKYFGFDAEKACYPKSWKEIDVDENTLLKDMLEGGVLGNLGTSRMHSSNITLNTVVAEKQGKKAKGAVLKTIFPSASKLAGRYKYLEKYPCLLPIAWISRILKYRKEVQESENNNPTESIEIGNCRVEMMKEYGVIKKN